MQILVTGVTGGVGRSLARRLLAAGHAVSGIATHPHPCLHPEVAFVCTEFDDPVLQQMADDADAVIHLAPIEPTAPGCAGIDGVVQVSHAAARAGARLVFVAQTAGQPALSRTAEELVSSGWAPNLIIRAAPLVGRQLDWAVCRTVASLLRAKPSSHALRLLHFDDLVRFLEQAVASDRTGVVDLASPDTVDVAAAYRLLHTMPRQPNAHRIRGWAQLTAELDLSALQDDWHFDCGWTAADALADTVEALAGARIGAAGATEMTGHVPLPVESAPSWAPADGTSLRCAAPDGLAGEFDDRIDARFPVFSARSLARILPGPLTPLTLDVQVSGLHTASRELGRALALSGVTATEWESRGIAVFGHRPFVGVSSAALLAGQLPGWDEHRLTQRALGAVTSVLFPRGRPDAAGNLPMPAARALVVTRALAMLRHLKADTAAYAAAALAAHLDATQLAALSDARLGARIPLLRDRIHQGWSMTALWVLDNGVTAAAVQRTGGTGPDTTAGFAAVLESTRPLDGSPVAADRAHRGPGEVELANPAFDAAPASPPAAVSGAPSPAPAGSTTMTARLVDNTLGSRETAYDATMRFTHELRKTVRETGSRLVRGDIIDEVDDVYYLTCDELLTMPADSRLRIKRRRAERERLQALRLPEVFTDTWAPVADGASAH